MKALRLLKVVVQPVFAIDDGQSLTEVSAEPIVVRPQDWPTYATTQFVDEVSKLQSGLDGEIKAQQADQAGAEV
jgi:hypothetical protein